jgi:hypothetical protein
MNNKTQGDLGEQEVVKLVPCPNCGKPLVTLPSSYPMVDVQCTGCTFRAQVKTNNCKPKPEIFGAGWDVVEKVLKSGYMMPPLITNFKWTAGDVEHQEISLYPFIPKRSLRKRQLSPTARRANYKMFNYTGLDKLPYFVLYRKDNL